MNTTEMTFEEMRKELREKYLTKAMLEDFPTELEAEFSGAGDSGDLYSFDGEKDMETFFSYILDKYVTFDWYNEEGGGGTILWKLKEDKIIINGYYNVTRQVDEMVDVEI